MPARSSLLLASGCVYGFASLVHFTHNALFAEEYPNLPGWITPAIVVATWLAISSIGVLAWLSLRWDVRPLGLGLLTVYAAFGFDAFGHYRLAPLTAHSVAMNVTIWFEGLSAIVLFVVTLAHALAPPRGPTVIGPDPA
jgi:hypothetical protein